ncbi:MAG: dockerin type I domain-containing protein [Phycisphaerae bacterium]
MFKHKLRRFFSGGNTVAITKRETMVKTRTRYLSVLSLSGRHLLKFILVVFLLVAAVTTQAQVNVALHRPYTWNVAPSYSLCTDSGDSTQLTDGVFSPSDPMWMFWTSMSTVGWVDGTGAIVLTLDLGQLEPINSISFRTAGGSSGVSHPAFIDVWTSSDNATYDYRGELFSMAWANDYPISNSTIHRTTGVYRYLADNLTLAGRYVKLAVYRGSGYMFCDEMEVFRGAFDPNTVPQSSTRLSGTSDFATWSRTKRYDPVARVRMLMDLQELESHPLAGTYATQIQNLRQQVLSMARINSLDMTLGVPYTSLHQSIWALNGEMDHALNPSLGRSDFRVSPAQLYQPLHPFNSDNVTGTGTIDIQMLGNESRSAAVNITNDTNAAKTVAITLTGFGNSLPTNSVTLHVVRFTEAQERFIASTALVNATGAGNNAWTCTLPAGAVSQLWLTVNSENVPNGEYSGQLEITPAGGSTMITLVTVKVYRGRLPDVPLVEGLTWDYTSLPASYSVITDQNNNLVMSLLEENRVQSHWLAPNGVCSTYGTYNSDGTYNVPPNFDLLNNWLNDLAASGKPTKRYYIYLNAATEPFNTYYSGGFAFGTLQWQTAVKSFFQAFVQQIDNRGLDRSSFVFCMYDEPKGNSTDGIAAAYGQMAKEVSQELKIFTNPLYTTIPSDQGSLDLLAGADIIMPQLDCLLGNTNLYNYYKNLQSQGKELGAFKCQEGGLYRGTESYFRSLAWNAALYGLDHIGVWAALNENWSTTWDDFRAQFNYEMIFANPTSVTLSKTLTAWRDGIQDCEYFRLLESTIGQCEAMGVPASFTLWAESKITGRAASALSSGQYDQERIQLLEPLAQLSTVMPKDHLYFHEDFNSGQLDPSRFSLIDPNPSAQTTVTSGKLQVRCTEEIITTQAFPLSDGEITFTAMMGQQGAEDGHILKVYNSDKSQYLKFVCEEAGGGQLCVSLRRMASDGTTLAVYFDTIITGNLSTEAKMLVLNIDSTELELSIVYPDSAVGGVSPKRLLYQGANSLNWTFNEIFFAMSNNNLSADSMTVWDDVYVSQIPGPVTVKGTVTLGDFTDNVTTVPVIIEIRDVDNVTALETHTVHLTSVGSYVFNTSLTGMYDLTAKASHWLRQKQSDIELSVGADVTVDFLGLVNGDCDGDNEITSIDLSIILSAMDIMVGDPQFDKRADLDADTQVTSTDLSILLTNMTVVGNP